MIGKAKQETTYSMPPTLIILITSCVTATAMGVILLIIANTYPKHIRGLKEWGISTLITALSIPLFMARDHIPDAFSIVLANLMLLIGFMVMNLGTRRFSGSESAYSRKLLLSFVLAYVSLFAWFTYVQPHVVMRVATLSVFTLVVILDHLIFALKKLPETTGRNIMVFSLSVLIISRILRLGGLGFGFDQPTGVFDATVSNIFFIALPSVMLPLGTISFIMLASEKLQRDMEFNSRHDGLTQCLNKKAAFDELYREINRAKRHGSKLSVMLIDLDNFKSINDTHGHLAGDEILLDFANRAKASLRDTDLLARFGGDEFMAILPDADLKQATQVANRLHETGNKGQPFAWSVSVGVSEWAGEPDTLATLLNRADKALYQAKASGRSQTQAL